MKKVGILTFHSSYNYGSVLQAQATQLAIENLGYDATIIDYRPHGYDDYDELYCARNRVGIKGRLFYWCIILRKNERRKRVQKFEEYFTNNLKLSMRVSSYKGLEGLNKAYDIFVSGSDQIWSDQVPEVKRAGGNTVLGYYLAFTDQKKIAYASCVASLKEEQLEKYRSYLLQYDWLSTRESIGVERIQNITGRKVELVLDPTLLLDKEQWLAHAKVSDVPLVQGDYVLLYSLRNFKAEKCWAKWLKKFAKKHNLSIVVVAPYFEFIVPGAKNMLNVGPKDFLNLYANAKVVCTDTFHGTAFAVNFNKPFFSLGTKYWKDDIRKTSLLKLLGLESRLIEDESDIMLFENYGCDFSESNRRIRELRTSSVDYLRAALKG